MRPPLPPFTTETAVEKVRAAEDAWNSRDPKRVALAYTPDCPWRNRDRFLAGHDGEGRWFRSYGNENWEFAEDGRMCRRIASINDLAIGVEERLFHWSPGPRPADHPGLSELGL